jgi:hypothetical protein
MTDKQTPPDWVLIEAAKRSDWDADLRCIRRYYSDSAPSFRALCDMIERYEQPPEDRKVLCAREAMRNGSNGKVWSKEEVGVRAIELYEGGVWEMTAPKAHWSEKEQQYWIRDLNGGSLWFDSVLDAQAAARQIEIDIAVKAREALIMQWLRKHGMRQVAMMLEREEHLK